MLKVCVPLALVLTLSAAGWADLVLLQDNYLGNPGQQGWSLPYDGIAAETSERNTQVTASWTGDDLVVPAGEIYNVHRIDWIGLLLDAPGATWDTVDVIIMERNPDGEGRPITPGDLPVAEYTGLTVDSFAQRDGETLYDLPVYEGSVSLPETALPAGHYYYAVRLVGEGFGRFYMTTTGGGTDFGAGEMGVFQSAFFFEPDWVNIDQVLSIPVDPQNPGGEQMDYPTDFSYRVWGNIVPEPASIALLLLGTLIFRFRR